MALGFAPLHPYRACIGLRDARGSGVASQASGLGGPDFFRPEAGKPAGATMALRACN